MRMPGAPWLETRGGPVGPLPDIAPRVERAAWRDQARAVSCRRSVDHTEVVYL